MSYLVLARKYRPQTFHDVVRQEHVTRTLQNAISAKRLAHAILFSGPRGTGKTTIARILAKAMNCAEGPAPTPCNVCRSCKEITSGNAADVFEIDGASNNGVDHIRELRTNIRYMPSHSRYKIYIIDEVHMLSTAAFNALLKTLEEPPAHILFFFATTEPHKIPITILSRCQRHDLRRIDLDDICNHMDALCKKENVEIAGESLGLIARESGGSMRDALSLLDQVMSGSPEGISHEQILDILGVVDRKILFELSAALIQGDMDAVLDIIRELYDHGHNLKEFYFSLAEHFRNLLLVRMGTKTENLVDVPAHETALMASQVGQVSELWLSQVLDAVCKEENTMRYSALPRLTLEMIFIRLFQIRPALPIDMLIEKLDLLRKGVCEESADFTPVRPLPAQVREKVSSPGQKISDSADKKREISSLPEAVSEKKPEAEKAAYRKQEEQTQTAQETAAPAEISDSSEEKLSVEPSSAPRPEVRTEVRTETGPAGQNPPEHHPREPEHKPPQNVQTEPPEVIWEKMTAFIAKESVVMGTCLNKCSLKAVHPDSLEIEVRGNSFNMKRLEKNSDMLRRAAERFFGRKMQIHLSSLPDSGKEKKESAEKSNQARQEAINHPLVMAAIEIFEGDLVDVKIL